MSNTIQAQHPAVVLRSSYQHLRALLAIAAIAIVGLTVAVVVLATTDEHVTTSSAIHVVPPAINTSGAGARLDHRGLKPNTAYYYPGHY